MFNPSNTEGHPSERASNFVMTDDIRIAIEDAGLTDDPATKEMVDNGFVGLNGKEWDPIDFIKQRAALVEAGVLGSEAPQTREDQMVTHSEGTDSERKLSDIDA